jgi:hypothetical protein
MLCKTFRCKQEHLLTFLGDCSSIDAGIGFGGLKRPLVLDQSSLKAIHSSCRAIKSRGSQESFGPWMVETE